MRPIAILQIAALVGASAALGQQREKIEPGFNLFSKEQDVAMGQEAATEIEKQVQVVDDRELTRYISDMGQRLAKESQDPSYPFTFKVVNDPSINAFALPGGPIYVHTGLIAQADNEAQLAGVIGHEIGHVVLRHSTNQASKSSLFQLPALLAAGALDKQGGMLAALGQVGIGLGLNSVLLKYGRGAEKDADIVGARMMYDVGYDPQQAAMFFEKLQAAGGARGPAFLSSHPDPGNRSRLIQEEIAPYPNKRLTTNSDQFARMKARAQKLTKSAAAAQPAATSGGGSQSAQAQNDGKVEGRGFTLEYPRGWTEYAAQDAAGATIVPENGVVGSGDSTAIARGILVGLMETEQSLDAATSALVADLQRSNPGLDAGQRQSMTFGGRTGLSSFLVGQSPLRGQDEYVWLVSARLDRGLFYMLMISPEGEYDSLAPTYEDVVRSVRF